MPKNFPGKQPENFGYPSNFRMPKNFPSLPLPATLNPKPPVHEKKKPCICKICKKVFVGKFKLKKHMAEVHQMSSNNKESKNLAGPSLPLPAPFNQQENWQSVPSHMAENYFESAQEPLQDNAYDEYYSYSNSENLEAGNPEQTQTGKKN